MSGIALLPPASAAAVAELAAKIPGVPTTPPVAEARTPQIGNPATFAAEDHMHPRLASVTGATASKPASHTIEATGLSPQIMFSRSFDTEPGLSITPITPAASDILLPVFVSRWVMDETKYVGVVVGWKKLKLNTSTLVVAGLTVLGGSSVSAEPATGTRFTCVAIARSDS